MSIPPTAAPRSTRPASQDFYLADMGAIYDTAQGHTDLSIKEVAYRTGFEEPLHLSGFFKKRTGVSPTAFRAERQTNPEALYL